MSISIKKKIIFVTGTRADYGKLKSIILAVQKNKKFETHVFITGMHNLNIYGNTHEHLQKDKISNRYRFKNQNINEAMDKITANTINGFSKYVKKINPDLIVIHGDRVEPLACAIVGCLNNILVAHIEGGEVSGTVDEILRHSISKLSHIHFVSNSKAKSRLIQLGELKKNIFIIGSPDIDLMLSKLPSVKQLKKKYEIEYNKFAIMLMHPVTTSPDKIEQNATILIDCLIKSKFNYVILFPNNDYGSSYIIKTFQKLKNNSKFKIFSSMRFEFFLTLLKNAHFIIGNSSSGVKEAPYYGVPTINLGSRQNNRSKLKSIKNSEFNKLKILNLINHFKKKKIRLKTFMEIGKGNSNQKFLNIILKKNSGR